MTKPTIDNPPGLPGIRDYLVTIPVRRPGGDGDERAELRVRIPAPSPGQALVPAKLIGLMMRMVNEPGAWTPDIDNMTVTDVNDTPAVDELLVQLEHQKRILAALAAKLPMILHLTPDEYAAADPDSVQAIPLGDGMMFTAKLGPQQPGPAEPLLLPADPPDKTALPGPHGGHHDPDVRKVRAGRLEELAKLGKVEIEDGAYWLPVETVTYFPTGQVIIRCTTQKLPYGGDYKEVTVPAPHHLITVRPVTVETYGEDLMAGVTRMRQILAGDGWWWLTAGDRLPEHVNVTLGRTGETRRTSFTLGEPVLLRDDPDGWWPR